MSDGERRARTLRGDRVSSEIAHSVLPILPLCCRRFWHATAQRRLRSGYLRNQSESKSERLSQFTSAISEGASSVVSLRRIQRLRLQSLRHPPRSLQLRFSQESALIHNSHIYSEAWQMLPYGGRLTSSLTCNSFLSNGKLSGVGSDVSREDSLAKDWLPWTRLHLFSETPANSY